MDPQDPISMTLVDPVSYIFAFRHGILGTFDSVAATLSWDPRDLGSQTENMPSDPDDPGSCLGELWDFADIGSCIAIVSLYLEDHLHPMKFCLWFLASLHCLKLSTC